MKKALLFLLSVAADLRPQHREQIAEIEAALHAEKPAKATPAEATAKPVKAKAKAAKTKSVKGTATPSASAATEKPDTTG